MNKLFSRRCVRRIIELFILNNPMTWTSDRRGVLAFVARTRRVLWMPYVREIRAKMRKAGIISNEPAE